MSAPEKAATTRMYIHRRIVVRFLIALLIILSVASFATIALGLGYGSGSTPQEDFGTPTRLSDRSPFYVLLIGTDSLEGTALYTGDVNVRRHDDNPEADSVLLVRVDPEACTLTFVTVPSNTVLEDSDTLVRDTFSEKNPMQTVRTVERITGVSVKYYFIMGFSAFEELVGQVGDVTADVPVSITMQDPVTAKPVTVPAGKGVKLNPAATLAFIRSWDPYVNDGDAHRQLNVRNVMMDLIGQVLASPDDLVRKDLGVLEEQAQTNIDKSLLISLVTRFLDEKDQVKMYSCTGPYLTSGLNEKGEPIVARQVRAWRELMSVVDSGEDPAEVLPEYDFQGSDDDYVKPEQSASSSSMSTASSSASASSSSSASSKSSATSHDKPVKSSSSASSELAADETDDVPAEEVEEVQDAEYVEDVGDAGDYEDFEEAYVPEDADD